MSVAHLEALFKPNSVAVIGASSAPGHPGLTIMRHLQAGTFLGPIMPLSMTEAAIGGVIAYKSVDTLPLTPDLAVLCCPLAEAPEYVRQLGRRGCRSIVALCPDNGSYDEDARAEIDAEMMFHARHWEARILGPGGMGYIVSKIGLNASLAEGFPVTGKTAVITQSASLFSALLGFSKRYKLGFSHVLSVGDALDITVADLLDFLGNDADTKSILLYLENVHDSRRFFSAMRAAARVKPVLVLRPGKRVQPSGAQTIGADEVYEEAFRRAGALRVENIDELFRAALTLGRVQPLRGEHGAIVSNGGSVALMAADRLLIGGGQPTEFSESTVEALAKAAPGSRATNGVVALPFDAAPAMWAEVVRTLFNSPEVNAVMALHVPFAGVSSQQIAKELAAVSAKSNRTLLACMMGFNEEALAELTAAGVPFFETPDGAIQAFLILARHRRNQELMMEMPAELPASFTIDRPRAWAAIEAAINEGRKELTDIEAREVVAAYGVPVVETRFCETIDEAMVSAVQLGFPVAVKIKSPDIPQPFEIGAMALDLDTAAKVAEACASILGRVRMFKPDAVVTGFTVQRMIRRTGTQECSVEMSVDPDFGPFMRFGQGGLAARITHDRAVALPPLSLSLARELVFRTRVAKLLEGYDHDSCADIASVALTLVGVSELVTDFPEIQELQINPLIVDCAGVQAVNVRIRVDKAEGEGQARLAIRPYPRELEETVVLKNGEHILLRPIRPEDEPAHFGFFAKLTPEDLRFRFFGVIRDLSHREMAKLTQIDYEREMAFIATRKTPGGDSETLGVVRAATKADEKTAEFAIIIRSDLKGLGLGRLLMEKIIRYCRAAGMEAITGQALLDNAGMQGLAAKVGFDVRKDYEEELVDMRLDLVPHKPETFSS